MVLLLAPGSSLNNYNTEVFGATKVGLGKVMTKGATWSGATGAGNGFRH